MYTFFDDMSCVLVYNEYFFLNGKGVQIMQGRENMAADTWDLAQAWLGKSK